MGLEPHRSAESGMTTRGIQTTLTHIQRSALISMRSLKLSLNWIYQR